MTYKRQPYYNLVLYTIGGAATCTITILVMVGLLIFQKIENQQNYELQATYVPSGEVVVLDTDLTITACADELINRSEGWGTDVRFDCVITPDRG